MLQSSVPRRLQQVIAVNFPGRRLYVPERGDDLDTVAMIINFVDDVLA